jgi:hypothetical protein
VSSPPPDDPTRRYPASGPSGTPPYGYPAPGNQQPGYPPYGSQQPGYPPYVGPPPGGPPPGYGVPPPPEHQGRGAQQRRGCRGCLLTCLTVFLACALLAVIVVAAGVYMVRQAFPTATSTQDLVTCVGLRVLVNNEELILERGNATPEQKAEIRRGFEELRTKYQRECVPGR